MNPQEILNDRRVYTRKRRPKEGFETIAKDYTHAMIHLTPTAVRVQSLLDGTETSRELECPKDNANAAVVVDGELVRGEDCCQYCQSMVQCAVSGRNRTFMLMSHSGASIADLLGELS